MQNYWNDSKIYEIIASILSTACISSESSMVAF